MDSGKKTTGYSTDNVSGRGGQNVSRPTSATNTKRHVQVAIYKGGNIYMESAPSGSSGRETAGGAHVSKYSVPAALPPSVPLTSNLGKDVTKLGCKTSKKIHSPASCDTPHAQDSLVNVAVESLHALVSDTGSRIFRRSTGAENSVTSRRGEDADDEESSYFLVGRRHKVIRSRNAARFKDKEKDSSEEDDTARSSKTKVRRRVSRTYKSSTTNFLSTIISSDMPQSSGSPNTSLLTFAHERNTREKTRVAVDMASSSLHPVAMDSDEGASPKLHWRSGAASPDSDIHGTVSLHEVVSAMQGLDDDKVAVPQQLNRTRNAKCELHFTSLHEDNREPFIERFLIESDIYNSDTLNNFQPGSSLSQVQLDKHQDNYSCRKKFFSLNEQVQIYTVDSGNGAPFDVDLDNKSNNANGDGNKGTPENRKIRLVDDKKHARASTGTEATQYSVGHLHDALLHCRSKKQVRRFKHDASNGRVSNPCLVGHFTLEEKTKFPNTKTEDFKNKVTRPSKFKRREAIQKGVTYVKEDNFLIEWTESDYSGSKASDRFEKPEVNQEFRAVKYSAALASKYNCTNFKSRQAMLKDAMLARIRCSDSSTIKRRRSVTDQSNRNSTDQNNIPNRLCSGSTTRPGFSQNTYTENALKNYSKELASHQKIQRMQRTFSGMYGSLPQLNENPQEENMSHLHNMDRRGKKLLGRKTLKQPEFLKTYLYCHKEPPTPRFVPLRCPMLCVKAVIEPEVSSDVENVKTNGCLNFDKTQSQPCEMLAQRKALYSLPIRRGMLYTAGTLASGITHNHASSLSTSSNNKYIKFQMKQPSHLQKSASESIAKRICTQEDTNRNVKPSVSENTTVADELPRVITCHIAGKGSVIILSASQVAVDLHEVFDWNFTPVSDTLAEEKDATPSVSLLQKQNAGKLKSSSKTKDVNLKKNRQSNGLQVTGSCLPAEPGMPPILPCQSSSNRSTNKGQHLDHVPSAAENENPSVAGNSRCENHENKDSGWLGSEQWWEQICLFCVAEHNTARQPINNDIVNPASVDEGVLEKQNKFKTENKTLCSLLIPQEEKWTVGKFEICRSSGDKNNTEITVDDKYRASSTEIEKGFGDKQVDQQFSFNMAPETIAGGDTNVVKDKNDMKQCSHKHLPPVRFCSSPSAVQLVVNGEYSQHMEITLQVATGEDLIVTSKELISASTIQKQYVSNTTTKTEKRHEILEENTIKADKTQRRTEDNATTKKETGVGGHSSSITDSWKMHMFNEGVVWYAPVTTELQRFKYTPLPLEDCIAGLREKTIQPHCEDNKEGHSENKTIAMEESAENEQSRNSHTDQSKNSVLRFIFSLTPIDFAGGHALGSVVTNVSKENSVNNLNGNDRKDGAPTSSKPRVQLNQHGDEKSLHQGRNISAPEMSTNKYIIRDSTSSHNNFNGYDSFARTTFRNTGSFRFMTDDYAPTGPDRPLMNLKAATLARPKQVTYAPSIHRHDLNVLPIMSKEKQRDRGYKSAPVVSQHCVNKEQRTGNCTDVCDGCDTISSSGSSYYTSLQDDLDC